MSPLDLCWFTTGLILGAAGILTAWILYRLAVDLPEPQAPDISAPDQPSRRWDDIDLEYRILTTEDGA